MLRRLVSDAAQGITADRTEVAIGIEKAGHPLGLLKMAG